VKDNRWMPFALSDYDLACVHVISDVTKAIARAGDPVLSQIKVVPMAGTVSSVIETRGETALDLPAEPVGFELGVNSADVRDGNFEALQVQLVEAADGYAEQLAKMVYGSLNKITTATGNTFDAGGRSPTFEMVYEMLDKIEWALDENDELSTPSLVMHPDTASKLPRPTPEQEKMIEELKARKLEELLAKRRCRRLS
jgi:hypothetical protein